MGYRLGIDLGTTFTAAAIERDGRAEVVQLGDHAPQVPSLVFARESGELLVGDAAARRGGAQPDRLAREFKRRLGDGVPFVLGGQDFTAEALTARLLRWVVDTVREREGSAPDRIALTHPANWGSHRREVLLRAVRLAEVGPVTTMTEPAAAAVHFASTERAETGAVLAVYDLGGGTFDAAVLRRTSTDFELLGSPDGVEQLGGVDFDAEVFGHVRRTLRSALAQLDTDDAAVLAGLARLRRECTDAKEALSVEPDVEIPVALPGLTATTVRLSRAELEDMIRPSIEQTVACLRRAMASAVVAPEDVHTVVLVGGSARIPLVTQMLGHDLGRPVAVSPQPKHAVALGAALLAGGVLPTPPGPTRSPPPTGDDRSGKSGPASGRDPGPVGPPGLPRPALAAPAKAGVRRLTGALVGLLVLAVGLAFLLPALSRPGDPADPPVTVDAVGRVDRGPEFRSDLAQPLPVTMRPEGVPDGTEVSLTPTLFGFELGTGVTSTVARGAASLKLNEYPSDWVAGPVPTRLTVGTVANDVVLVPTTPFAVSSALPIGLTLYVIAYAESLMRPLRRRRTAGRTDVAAMAAVGAAGGLALVTASWAFGKNLLPPWVVLGVVLACASAGAVAVLLVAARPRARGRTG